MLIQILHLFRKELSSGQLNKEWNSSSTWLTIYNFFSAVRVAHMLLFLCIYLVTLCSLLCMYVFHVWPFSLDYFLLISARTLVPLITLSFGGDFGLEYIPASMAIS